MDEIVLIMTEILGELREINSKLDDIKGYGIDNSITDICSKLDDLKGSGINSIDDVCDKLDRIESSIDAM